MIRMLWMHLGKFELLSVVTIIEECKNDVDMKEWVKRLSSGGSKQNLWECKHFWCCCKTRMWKSSSILRIHKESKRTVQDCEQQDLLHARNQIVAREGQSYCCQSRQECNQQYRRLAQHWSRAEPCPCNNDCNIEIHSKESSWTLDRISRGNWCWMAS